MAITDSARRSHPGTWAESFALMGTVLTIRVVGPGSATAMRDSILRAVAGMRAVEAACTRFDPDSPASQLGRTPGRWLAVPPPLFHALAIALEVAELTDGRFDPSVGAHLEELGFNRHYVTGRTVSHGISPREPVSFRDIQLDPDGYRARVEKPMVIDLGAVAKGLAVDLAAQELRAHQGFSIDAGGDIFVFGTDPDGGPWRVGIENPEIPGALLDVLLLTEAAVCTSGPLKRRSPRDEYLHHLISPASGEPVDGLLSCTVVAPETVLADVMATAAYLMGPDGALLFIEDMGLAGLVVTENRDLRETSAMGRYRC
ncbi:MAG: FAD:protein FMN transferase [Clostridia bacterium]